MSSLSTCAAHAVSALERFISLKDIEHLLLTNLTPKHVQSLKALLKKRDESGSASQLQITLSNPAKQVLKSTMGMSDYLTVMDGFASCSVPQHTTCFTSVNPIA